MTPQAFHKKKEGTPVSIASVFKSEESRVKIRRRYQEILDSFPFRQRYVETSFGRTFFLEAGDPGRPALVLLHGSCANSAFWFPEMMTLSPAYHVLAVDILGEAGNSDENRPDLLSDGYADWLGEVLDAAEIEKAVVAGNSLGGWMTLKFASRYPERVEKLILLAPAGLAEVRTAFLENVRSDAAGSEPPTIDAVASEGSLPGEVEAFINLILSGFNPRRELPLFSDGELARLRMPILYVAGEEDTLLDTRASRGRLARLAPQADIRVLPGTGHMITNAAEFMVPYLLERQQ